jgi:pyocin large subunit-like protein
MTDAKSAVLLCVAWEAIWQERMALGERAGQAVARLSAVKLAELTGCRLQTVQRAISELKRIGVIEVVDESPGKTNVYRLTLNAETLQADN